MGTVSGRGNKSTYLMHYQLIEAFGMGYKLMLRLNLVIFGGFLLIMHEYPTFMASLDFYFFIFSLIFLFVLKPKMLRGSIQAYYCRDYRKMKIITFPIQLFIEGGALRIPLLFAYYGISYVITQNKSAEAVLSFKEGLMSIFINPLAFVVALAGFGLAFYLLFYNRKYTTIRDFSNSVVEIYNTYQCSEKQAVEGFVQRRDAELEALSLNSVKYDRENNAVQNTNPSEQIVTHIEPDTYYPEQSSSHQYNNQENPMYTPPQSYEPNMFDGYPNTPQFEVSENIPYSDTGSIVNDNQEVENPAEEQVVDINDLYQDGDFSIRRRGRR